MKTLKRLTLASCIALAMSPIVNAADFVFVDQQTLDSNRALLKTDKATKSMQQAYERLIKEADMAKQLPSHSVTYKGMTPPSGSKNDYLSISPYWWPDETKADGLPWIRHDGKVNPASKTDETDSRRIGLFTRSVRALAIAYYFSQDEKYAKKGIDDIRTWFFNPETKMNPNMNFGQGVPGRADGRRSGLIDSRSMAERMLDAVAMLSTSPYWTESDETNIKAWYGEYLDWLLTDKLAGGPKGEAFAENNHGSWYDLQVAGIAYFLGNEPLAKKMAEKGKMRIDTQFDAKGQQPHELGRTRSYHYSYFNLDALVGVAQIGDKVGVDLWNYQSTSGASLKVGINLMAQYNDPNKQWEHVAAKGKRRVERMAPIYLKAGKALGDETLTNLALKTDFSHFSVEKNLAEIWAQRDIELLYTKHEASKL